MSVLRAEGLGKRYAMGAGRRSDEQLWALRDVSFGLERGGSFLGWHRRASAHFRITEKAAQTAG